LDVSVLFLVPFDCNNLCSNNSFTFPAISVVHVMIYGTVSTEGAGRGCCERICVLIDTRTFHPALNSFYSILVVKVCGRIIISLGARVGLSVSCDFEIYFPKFWLLSLSSGRTKRPADVNTGSSSGLHSLDFAHKKQVSSPRNLPINSPPPIRSHPPPQECKLLLLLVGFGRQKEDL
jgi:hypothetical protein